MKISITAQTENPEAYTAFKSAILEAEFDFTESIIGNPYPKPKTYQLTIVSPLEKQPKVKRIIKGFGLDVVEVKTIEDSQISAIETFNCDISSSVKVFLDFPDAEFKAFYPTGYLEINEEDVPRLEQSWFKGHRIKVVNAFLLNRAIQYVDLSAVVCMKLVPPQEQAGGGKHDG